MTGAPDLRTQFVFAAALGLGACTRGCDLGPPAEPCTSDRECEAPSTCHRGYCHSQEYIAEDRQCRAAPACAETGRCRSITVRSFLGADSSRECGAAEEADCRAARVCGERGLCGLGDGWCIADDDAACARSRRCETHEECAADSLECVRRWPACAPLEATSGPAWAQAFVAESSIDMTRMGETWQPGAVDWGTVACEVELPKTWPALVRIGERCAPGPTMHGKSSTFVRFGVRLHPGDSIAVASQMDPLVGRPSRDAFIKAQYVGTSPFQVGAPGESLVCHVVAPEVARTLGQAALAEADAAIAKAAEVRPGQFDDMSPPLDDSRRSTAQAGIWLGWDGPEVVARLGAMERVERAFGEAMGRLIAQLRAKATPPRTLAAPADSDLLLEVLGHVCGDELNARRDAEARRPVDSDDCGLELRLEHRGNSDMLFSAGKDWFGPFRHLRWLRASGGVGEASPTALVDIKIAGQARDRRAELEPGQQAVILLVGEHEDLPLGRAASGEVILLSGSVGYHGGFVLRTELERDPAAEKAAAGKRKARAKRKTGA